MAGEEKTVFQSPLEKPHRAAEHFSMLKWGMVQQQHSVFCIAESIF